MRRREFITLLGGAAVAWPLAARGQQRERIRRIGVLVSGLAADDSEWQTRSTAFVQALAQLGWIDGRNMHIDSRFGLSNLDRQRKYAAELVALKPDVILAAGGGGMGPLLQETQTVPIVFANITDPVGNGFVRSLARPGGNATGFMALEFSTSGKWLELLKQIAPRVARVAVLRNRNVATQVGQFAAIQGAAASLRIELTPIDASASQVGTIERDITDFARAPDGGPIAVNAGINRPVRERIIALTARYRLPAVYAFRGFTHEGGLMSYGIDQAEPYRLAAGYVDRVLKGEKPADLPVQAPTKYETVINLKTAKALGLTVPPTLLTLADEVIE
jgi:putative ABC transport system substrate-binding protein